MMNGAGSASPEPEVRTTPAIERAWQTYLDAVAKCAKSPCADLPATEYIKSRELVADLNASPDWRLDPASVKQAIADADRLSGPGRQHIKRASEFMDPRKATLAGNDADGAYIQAAETPAEKAACNKRSLRHHANAILALLDLPEAA